jgi:hypothetical protein
MKSKILLPLIVSAAIVFNSCDDGMPETLTFNDFMKVYFIPAVDGTTTLEFFGAQDTTLRLAGIRYGGTNSPAGEVSANLALNNTLISYYNELNETEYEPIPDGCVTLSKNKLTISAKDFASDMFTIRINDGDKLELDKSYLIPLTISGVEGNVSLYDSIPYTTKFIVVNRHSSAQDYIDDMNEHLKGVWTFDDAANPYKATVGADLVPGFGSGSGPYSYGDFTYDYTEIYATNGPSATNGAVYIPYESFMLAKHGIAANGGGSNVNEYTLLIDFRFTDYWNDWGALFNTDLTNSNSADLWHVGGQIGMTQSASYGDDNECDEWSAVGYTASGEWHRLVLVVNLTENKITYYFDGVKGGDFTDAALVTDCFMSLDPAGILLAADGTAYDNDVEFSEVRIWDKPLVPEQIVLIGTLK